ncbi:unnamed protein product [Fusarium graminearum]|nr:unnamed protein product [Fusarium graminearum]
MSKSRMPLILGGGVAAGIGYYLYAAGGNPRAAEKNNVEAVAKDAKAEAMRVVDKFDNRVEAEAAKAKGGISSWFGGGK